MTTSTHLLHDLDTTVTLTWDDTRSMGTLLEFGGRRLLLTALRAPPLGSTAFLRIERDDHSEAIAVDGKVTSVTESEWGEQQIEMDIERVGTTGSPVALRAFLDRHYIEAGGTVAAGRSRDNPDQKRYVYTLPTRNDAPAARTQATAPATAPAPVAPPVAPSLAAAWPAEPAAATSTSADSAAIAATAEDAGWSVGPSAPAPQRQGLPDFDTSSLVGANPYAQPAAANRPPTMELGDADELMAALDAAARGLSSGSGAFAAHLSTARAGAVADTEATRHVSPVVRSMIDPEHDESEEILVETVAPSSQQAAVVSPSPPPLSIRPAAKTATAAAPSRPAASAPTPAGLAAVPAATLAAQLYAGDTTVRLELAVQFEAGVKKRKYDGVLVRLGDAKLRVRSNALPERYERVVVLLPGKQGAKDAAPLKCEVTRVQGDSGVGEPSFDAKVVGANSPVVMARLRQLVQEMGQAAGTATP